MLSRRTLITSAASAAALAGVGYALWPGLDGYDDAIARQRHLLSGDPTRQDLLRMATLAANGHNTQPWTFRLTNKGVQILPDFTRRTEVVDPDDHHLYVSLGCAAENLVIAARAHGQNCDVSLDVAQGFPVIDIRLSAGQPDDPTLYKAIPLRQSTRSAYDGQPVSTEDLSLLQAAAKREGVDVLFFTEAAQLETVAEFVVAGNSAQMDDPAFIAELRDWLRFSPDKAVQMGDGLFSICSGNPALPEWLGGRLFDAVFTKDNENAKYRDHVRSSAGVAVFVADKANPAHWINVGRSFERFALQATALGIRNAHINQPIEVPELRQEFARWLDLPDRRPDLVIRFGRAPALPMSLRRPVDSLLV
ncbi:nitroreductase family protein [uncultured Tateyamaria sp.]|uniref:Acg family FMN-binding oxidoreductase n=1 Tax=uncultured Tateyamaria sp. TaxID=455651 RepID=UPI0026311F08|nr:nitroreductase family protein [uncultured Tateyamaria sp.]